MIAPPSPSSSATSSTMDEEPTTTEIRIVQKPHRPLSAYNLFFKYQRKIIAEERKAAGDVGFCSMAKIVAQRWKAIDEESKKHFDALAVEEKLRHKKAMKAWKALQKKHQKKKKSNNSTVSRSPSNGEETSSSSDSVLEDDAAPSDENNYSATFGMSSVGFSTMPKAYQLSSVVEQQSQGPFQSFVPTNGFQEMQCAAVLPQHQVECLAQGLDVLASSLNEEDNLVPFIQLFS